MSIDLKLPVGTFLRISVSEYRKTLNGSELSPKMLDEVLEKADVAWHAFRKPKKKVKPRIDDDAAWIESIKADPAMAGVDVTKEVNACRFWCANRKPAVVMSRARLVNWLNRADRAVGTGKSAAPAPYPGPAGWLEWARANLPDWKRFTEEKAGYPVPAWDKLDPHERNAIVEQMKKEKA